MTKMLQKANLCSILICLILIGIQTTALGQDNCSGPPAYSEIFSLDNTKSIDTPKMVSIPAGSFQMGDWNDVGGANEKPVHTVNLQHFSMSIHEITNAQFAQFVESGGYNQKQYWLIEDGSVSNPDVGWSKRQDLDWEAPLFWDLTVSPYWKYDVYSSQEKTPVVGISWYEAYAFCQWLSAMTNEKYRLPTEAEWEYAARGGLNEKKLPWGNTLSHDAVNYSGTSGVDQWFYTAPVGSFEANAFGLYDMSGNVWEWCLDWYQSDYYQQSPSTNPAGPDVGTFRVVRGGSFNDKDIHYLRCAARIYDYPDSKTDFSGGFRVVREVQ